jgi:hypothetical protein
MQDIVCSPPSRRLKCGLTIIYLVTTGKIMTLAELDDVKGRAWEDVDVSAPFPRVPRLCSRNPQLTCRCGSLALMIDVNGVLSGQRQHVYAWRSAKSVIHGIWMLVGADL